jgi:outer membrane protein OmpA-like peptidoglycan-associated protein
MQINPVKYTLLISCHILLINIAFAQTYTEIYPVYFETDKSEIQAVILPKLTVAVSDTITIEAHCDSRGSNRYNTVLALKRAEAVKTELKNVNKFPDGFNIQVRAFGEEKPKGDNRTEAGRKSNRRVDIIVRRQPSEKMKAEEIVLAKPNSDTAKTLTSQNLNEELQRSISTGQNIRIKNLNFKPGLDIIVPQSEPVLYELLKLMKDNPNLEIELQGYVCCTETGSDGANFRTGSEYLSRDRAKAVFDFLVSKGIDEKRLEYEGYGGSNKIVNPEITSADQDANRRVEIRVKKF